MATTRRVLGTYQMLWDCDACGSKKLLGKDHRHCPNCGQVQDENRRYLPDQREAVPTTYSPAPDNECDHCGTPNSYKANNCVNCGGPMEGTKAVHKRAPTSSMAAETVEDAETALEARQKAARAKATAFHSPEAHRSRERERAQEAQRHKERERARKADYERTRAEAEERNRRQGDLWKEREGFADPEPEYQPQPPKLQTLWDQHKRHIAIGAGILAIVGAIWLIFFWEKTVEVEVDSRYWERSQVIERFKTIKADDWCNSKPHDAYNVSSHRKVHHHETITDCTNCDCHDEEYKSGESCHQSCSTSRSPDGAGGFDVVETCHDVCTPEYSTRQVCVDRTHEEPVYEDYCNYNLDRWRPQRTARESGGATIEPVWPELVYDQCPTQALGCERPGGRNATYQVHFRDLNEPEKYECEWDQTKWSGYDVGSHHEAIVKVIGGRFQCDSLTRSSL